MGPALALSVTSWARINHLFDERPVLLVADPDSYTWSIVQLILGSDFRVEHVRSYKEVKDRVLELRPQAILCEYRIANPSILASDQDTRDIPTLFISGVDPQRAGSDVVDREWLPKELLNRDLKKRIAQRIQAQAAQPLQKVILTLAIDEKEVFLGSLSGDVFLDLRNVGTFPLSECTVAASRLRDAEQNISREGAEREGAELYRMVFNSEGVRDLYRQALATGRMMEVRLTGNPELLAIPFEMLSDPEGAQPFVIRHALTRGIGGIFVTRPPLSRTVFEMLPKRGRPRVLLIGSDPRHETEIHVDFEIENLRRSIITSFRRQGFEPAVVALKTSQASFRRVFTEISKPDWDIIHYAGHGESTGSLRFFEGRRPDGISEELTGQIFQDLLRQSKVRFVYLSCCTGTEALGRSLAEAGVPAFLLFRWSHSGVQLAKFAERFYGDLAIHRDLEVALLRTRHWAYHHPDLRSGLLWASSVLVRQS